MDGRTEPNPKQQHGTLESSGRGPVHFAICCARKTCVFVRGFGRWVDGKGGRETGASIHCKWRTRRPAPPTPQNPHIAQPHTKRTTQDNKYLVPRVGVPRRGEAHVRFPRLLGGVLARPDQLLRPRRIEVPRLVGSWMMGVVFLDGMGPRSIVGTNGHLYLSPKYTHPK